jgi:hypothetical protein
MQVSDTIHDVQDVTYILTYFLRLTAAEKGDGEPGPAYIIDGELYVPPDYFEQERDPVRFRERFIAEAVKLGLKDAETLAVSAWKHFLTGIYGVCLNSVTPENIARKQSLLQRIETLTAEPRREDARWVAQLRDAVNELDALERPFSPVYDRIRFGRPPTRDSHINDVRLRFPEITRG